MPDAPVPQLPAHDPGQGTHGGFGNVRHLQKGGVQLVAGAQGGDDGDTPLPRLLDQVQLAGHQVDAVGDIVEFPGEKVLPVGGVIGGAQGVDPDVRVDVPAPPGRRLRLILPHGGGQGVQLAVDVGEAQGVLIHQGQLPHPGAGQYLGGIAAHAAQAEHRHMAAGEPVQGPVPQDHFRP